MPLSLSLSLSLFHTHTHTWKRARRLATTRLVLVFLSARSLIMFKKLIADLSIWDSRGARLSVLDVFDEISSGVWIEAEAFVEWLEADGKTDEEIDAEAEEAEAAVSAAVEEEAEAADDLEAGSFSPATVIGERAVSSRRDADSIQEAEPFGWNSTLRPFCPYNLHTNISPRPPTSPYKSTTKTALLKRPAPEFRPVRPPVPSHLDDDDRHDANPVQDGTVQGWHSADAGADAAASAVFSRTHAYQHPPPRAPAASSAPSLHRLSYIHASASGIHQRDLPIRSSRSRLGRSGSSTCGGTSFDASPARTRPRPLSASPSAGSGGMGGGSGGLGAPAGSATRSLSVRSLSLGKLVPPSLMQGRPAPTLSAASVSSQTQARRVVPMVGRDAMKRSASDLVLMMKEAALASEQSAILNARRRRLAEARRRQSASTSDLRSWGRGPTYVRVGPSMQPWPPRRPINFD